MDGATSLEAAQNAAVLAELGLLDNASLSALIDDLDQHQKTVKIWTEAFSGLNIKAYTHSTSSGLNAVKVHLVTKATKYQLLEVLGKNFLQRHKYWSPDFDKGKVIQTISDEFSVVQLTFNPGSLFQTRDFVLLRRIHEFPDGTIAIAEKSIDHRLAPVIKSVVRCHVYYQLRLIKQAGEECHLWCMNLTDVKGWIPTSLVNLTNVEVSCEQTQKIAKLAIMTDVSGSKKDSKDTK